MTEETASITLAPDWSWVGDDLTRFAGGVQAACIILAVACLAIGALRWAATKVTRTLVDDPRGDAIIISCLVGALLLSCLGGAVAWGVNHAGGGVSTSTTSTGGSWASLGGATTTGRKTADAMAKADSDAQAAQNAEASAQQTCDTSTGNTWSCIRDRTNAAEDHAAQAAHSGASAAYRASGELSDSSDSSARSAADAQSKGDVIGMYANGFRSMGQAAGSWATRTWGNVSNAAGDFLRTLGSF